MFQFPRSSLKRRKSMLANHDSDHRCLFSALHITDYWSSLKYLYARFNRLHQTFPAAGGISVMKIEMGACVRFFYDGSFCSETIHAFFLIGVFRGSWRQKHCLVFCFFLFNIWAFQRQLAHTIDWCLGFFKYVAEKCC